MLKNLPSMKETWVQSLGREDPMEYLVYIFKWGCMAYSYYCDINIFNRYYPWVRKIPLRRKWKANPVSLPGKFH